MAVLALVLSSCALFFPPVHQLSPPPSTGLEPPDSTQPAAGICQPILDLAVVMFILGVDTPNPRCGIVVANQQLRVVNETSEAITVTFNDADLVLEPGADHTFTPTFGSIWEPGVHVLHTTAYAGGGGPEIWLAE